MWPFQSGFFSLVCFSGSSRLQHLLIFCLFLWLNSIPLYVYTIICCPIHSLIQLVVPCPVLTVASWPTYRFLRRQVRRCGIPFILRIFHSLLSATVTGFRVVNETDVFVEFLAFSMIQQMLAIWSLVPLSFLNPACTIWKFLVRELLKLSLKDFEHNLASMWNECNCTVVWTFFGVTFLWDWNEN